MLEFGQRFKDGDAVAFEIAGIGTLEHTVVE
ncbi:fumarylacetoacetate hydrolase family protein [Natrinema pallidum]|nr:fumarylacetoacetate hydrolase family protein [Natrinema pallidum]